MFPDAEWVREVTFAEDQHDLKPLTGAYVTIADGSVNVYARWTLTPEERQRIAAGEDIYIAFPKYMYPHCVSLRPEWATHEGDQ